MALYFFDSSALVKRYVHEQGSTWVRDTTATASEHLIHLSLLTTTEIASALARRQREGSLSPHESDRLFGAFLADCARSYLLLRIDADIIQRALSLVRLYPLRSADAIQLATAVVLRHTLREAQFGPIVVTSADDRILQAAIQEDLPVENPNLR